MDIEPDISAIVHSVRLLCRRIGAQRATLASIAHVEADRAASRPTDAVISSDPLKIELMVCLLWV